MGETCNTKLHAEYKWWSQGRYELKRTTALTGASGRDLLIMHVYKGEEMEQQPPDEWRRWEDLLHCSSFFYNNNNNNDDNTCFGAKPSLFSCNNSWHNTQQTDEILITNTQTKTVVWCHICTVLLPPQESVGGRSSRLEATDYWDCVGILVKNWYNEKPTGWLEKCAFVCVCGEFNSTGGGKREYYSLTSFTKHTSTNLTLLLLCPKSTSECYVIINH